MRHEHRSPSVAATRANDIADTLRHQIIHDLLAPGARIQQRQFADRLGVSQTPLRDAVKILAREGLVELAPNLGARVIDYSAAEIVDMLSVYVSLESFAGRLACEGAEEADIARIADLLKAVNDRARTDDRIDYFAANQAFHMAIVAASHNQTLIGLHRQLNLRLHRTRYLALINAEDWRVAASQHDGLFGALAAREGERLEQLLRQHMLMSWEFVERWLDRDGRPSSRQPEEAK